MDEAVNESVAMAAMGAPGGAPAMLPLSLLKDVEMQVSVELGRARMPIGSLLSLAPGDVIELDRSANAPVDVLVNGTLLARGEVVLVDDEFGVRITEVTQPPAGAGQ
ncbi:MAG: flagellar motor switch protein FliN [Actinomycetota bacterium]|nr:flagellar motor switch protein FliN [Actinomycetota bacterium]MDA8209320.1 flagellar motor switch protein FliN [Actinomycetota bacterium]